MPNIRNQALSAVNFKVFEYVIILIWTMLLIMVHMGILYKQAKDNHSSVNFALGFGAALGLLLGLCTGTLLAACVYLIRNQACSMEEDENSKWIDDEKSCCFASPSPPCIPNDQSEESSCYPHV